jgi:8-hydroxy-5-deazaflavin:NADPH oxidoreductase
MKKTIAIIGATGKMGSALAGALAKGPYRLLLFGRKQELLNKLAGEILNDHPGADLECSSCAMEACWEADIIISAVPFDQEDEIIDRIRKVSTQKIVVSISNPFNNQFDGLVTPPDTSAAELLQQKLPDSKVVKAFNTIFAADFHQPFIEGNQLDCLIAGNDPEALETVAALASTAGFNPLIAGGLSQSRILENMTVLLMRLNRNYHYEGFAGWKVLHGTKKDKQ